MTDREDKLRLNSLDRFSKKSTRLVLESHGHCEVPAGCGGVILRWIDPTQERPLLLWIYVAGKSELWIDERIPSSGRPVVRPGRRAVGLHLTELKRGGGFMFAAMDDHPDQGRNTVMQPIPLFRSEDDGTWKYTVVKPGDDSWLKPGFDESGWNLLTAVSLNQPGQSESGFFAYKRLKEAKAQALGSVGGEPEIWIRAEFDIPPLARKGNK